jgi:hypothetical protein
MNQEPLQHAFEPRQFLGLLQQADMHGEAAAVERQECAAPGRDRQRQRRGVDGMPERFRGPTPATLAGAPWAW